MKHFFDFSQKSASLSLGSRLLFEQRFPKSFLALKSVRQLCFWGRKVDTSKMNTCQALLDIFAQKCLTGVQFWENAKNTISDSKSCTMYQWFFTILPRCKTCSRCRRNAPLIWRNSRKVTPSKMSAKTQSKSTFSRKVRKHYEFPVQLNPEKRKNVVLGQHFRSSRFIKVHQVVDTGDRAPAGRPASGLHSRRARTRSGRKIYRSGRLLPPPHSNISNIFNVHSIYIECFE